MKEYISPDEVNRFCRALQALDTADLPMANYPKRYFHHLFIHRQYFTEIYAAILNHVISYSIHAREGINLIDYGCGNGLLGIFAKFCGFGKVTLVDVSPEFIESAKYLSTALDIAPDYFVKGTVKDINVTPIPDVIIGTDVIEHIYDLDSFFSTLKKLNPGIITVFTTASNNKNWFKRRRLMQIQKRDEWKGWEENNSGDAYPSFRQIRRQIILHELPSITEMEIELLTTNTRGLNKADIIKACSIFKRSGKAPDRIQHPTNTCDPLSGSWTERLLSFKEYKKLYQRHSLQLKVYKGFYNSRGNFIKSNTLAVLNKIIQCSGKIGLHLSPHIILVGV